jgi:hypothetical protein
LSQVPAKKWTMRGNSRLVVTVSQKLHFLGADLPDMPQRIAAVHDPSRS